MSVTYLLSAINDNDSFGNDETDQFPAFTTSDVIYFDEGDISAADITLSGTNSTIITVNGKSFTLTNYSKDLFSVNAFVFTNGSVLQIGDGSSQSNLDAQSNTLYGTENNDYLDGRNGIDTVSYASALDAVLINLNTGTTGGGAGVDKLLNIENITGSIYNDTLIGGNGNNRIDGNGGLDLIDGGAGNDTIIVTSTYGAIDGGAGNDVIESSISFSLNNVLNVESLTLAGTAFIGVGSNKNNTINGNKSNNILDGGAGDDVLVGGSGDDIYIVDSNADIVTELAAGGADLVISTASSTIMSVNVENLKLNASTDQTAKGNTLDNLIYANVGNTTVDGQTNGLIGDTLSYRYGATSGVTVNLSKTGSQDTGGSGQDKITGIENLTGSNFNDNLVGNANPNIINGAIGNDTIDGDAGKDTLIGGKGNDVYIADDTSDNIIELANEGIDTVNASISYIIGNNIENLTMTDIGTGTGNTLNNVLTSIGGATTLVGGTGNDTYVINGEDDVIIEQAAAGNDTVVTINANYNLGVNLENLTIRGKQEVEVRGNDLANIITSESTNSSSLYGLDGNDTLVGDAEDEYLDGGKGNDIINGDDGKDSLIGGDGNDQLDGGAGNDTIDGGLGTDVMNGGEGNDLFIVDSSTDSVKENIDSGIDTVQSSVTYTIDDVDVENLTLTGASNINATGNSADNKLIGNDGNNILDGKGGKDVMLGGKGDDTYIVSDESDVVNEDSDNGIDTVQASISYSITDADVEKLTLTGFNKIKGTGNSLDNTIIGNSSENTIDGKSGNDSLDGGSGNDIIIGGTGNDTIIGGSGIDQLIGGAGDDTYIVDDFKDVVQELANEGTDTVISSATFALNEEESKYVENLTLTATFTSNATGNSQDNAIIGSNSNNRIDGGGGIDILTGNGGSDTFVFSSLSDLGTTSSTDQITDFAHGDKIDVKLLYAGQSVTLLEKDGQFTGVGIAELTYITNGSGTLIQGDVDGDATVDFAIALLGFTDTLTKADFIFS